MCTAGLRCWWPWTWPEKRRRPDAPSHPGADRLIAWSIYSYLLSMTYTTYTPCPQGAGRAQANHTPPTRDVLRPRLQCGAALRTHVDGRVLGQASASIMFDQDKSLIVPRSPSLVPHCCRAVPRPDCPSCCEPRNRYPTPSFPRSRAAVWLAKSGPG
jgi:hypothetical protein